MRKKKNKTLKWTGLIIGSFISLSCSHEPAVVWQKALNNAFPLNRTYAVGDKDFYHIKTIYREMDDSGNIAHTTVLDGYFSREIKKLTEARTSDFLIWKYVKTGEGKNIEDIKDYRILPFTEDFQYLFEDWRPQQFPVDISTIPKTMDGWRFYVKLLDAHTFDVIGNRDNFKRESLKIGDHAIIVEEIFPVSMDFPPLYTDTYFINSPFTVTFHAITACSAEPSAILTFRSDGCRLHMKANINDMAFPSDGISSYWGEVFISLESGKILGGKILERVDLIIALPQTKKTIKHVTLREIYLDKMKKEEFDRLAEKNN